MIGRHRLKAGIAEPERTFIAEQRLGNYVPTATNSKEWVVVDRKSLNTDSRNQRQDDN
jgi:hypothetical protein